MDYMTKGPKFKVKLSDVFTNRIAPRPNSWVLARVPEDSYYPGEEQHWFIAFYLNGLFQESLYEQSVTLEDITHWRYFTVLDG